MTRWEYKLIILDYTNLTTELNKFGADGWELVQSEWIGDKALCGKAECIFKRQIK
jgi:hypothetical protein